MDRDSNQTTVVALYKIPHTGASRFFSFKPAKEYDPPSSEVTIHLDTVHNEVTFYYQLPFHDPEKASMAALRPY